MITLFTMNRLKSCLLFVAMNLMVFHLQSQTWLTLDPNVDLQSENDWAILPAKYHLAAAQQSLKNADLDNFTLPLPDGSLHTFSLFTISNFHPALAARYPEIRSYVLRSHTDPSIRGRLDMASNGIHAVIRHPKGEIYIDPIQHQEKTNYLSYFTSDYEPADSFLNEYIGHDHTFHEKASHFLKETPKKSPFARSLDAPVDLYIYDLALSCTGEYAQKHGGTIEGALTAMNTALNRINFVLESELAIRLRLIEENDSLVNLNGATDPFTNGNAPQMALENSNYLISKLGLDKYDVGHVFGTQCNNIVGTSGGVGTVCGANRGFGSSCEISTTDRFYIGVVCHELGHQFGAEHTWNNCPGSPPSQFNSGTAFEPGSGSTIMSYGGACQDQNIVSTADFYFHGNSIEDILFFSKVGTGKNCAEVISSGNHEPTVTSLVGLGLTIPISTPFRLSAEGEDMDGDDLTYTWEQFDAGIGAAGLKPIADPVGNGPIFRSVPPTSSPIRIVPALSKLVANVSNFTEVLPTYTRPLTFRITARDQITDGGGTAWEEIKLQVTGQAGPFVLETFNEPDTVQRGSLQEITWDVAGTDQAPVNCRFVDILLSVDGGFNYYDTLATGVFNDGSESVIIPDVLSENARIMVAAADNIFFDINDAILTIEEAETPAFAVDVSPHNQRLCLPAIAEVKVESFGVLSFSDSLEIVPISLPSEVTTIESQRFAPGDEQVIALDFSQATETKLYEVTFSIRSSTDTITQTVAFEAISNDFSDLQLSAPISQSGIGTRPVLSWTPSSQASSYRLEVSSSPAFIDDLLVVENIVGGNFELETLLQENQLYYWRVQPQNTCGIGSFSPTEAFHTLNLACDVIESPDMSINISQNTTVMKSSILNVAKSGTVSDLNFTKLEGFHEAFGDLTMELQSPAGTKATLFSNQCGFSNREFNLGFDDQASSGFDCTANFVNRIFRPESSFSLFTGEEFQGDWTLFIHDSVAGSGGRLTSWSIELCGSIFPVAPTLSRVDTVTAIFGSNTIISKEDLSAMDDEASAAEIMYTLLTMPAKGNLVSNAGMLGIGDQFSQSDIDADAISYVHTAEDTLTDFFSFTIIDGTGGWLSPQTLPIVISNESVPTRQFRRDLGVQVLPNPSDGVVQLRSKTTPSSKINITIFDLRGKSIASFDWEGSVLKTLDLTYLPSGLYTIHMQQGFDFAVEKISHSMTQSLIPGIKIRWPMPF